MLEEIIEIIDSPSRNWSAYLTYRFLKKDYDHFEVKQEIKSSIKSLIEDENASYLSIDISNKRHYFIYKKLKWDSDYFGFPVFKILYILFNHQNIKILNDAINKFCTITSNSKKNHYVIDIPSEDISLIQGLGNSPFRLIETRLNYFLNDFSSKDENRYPIRLAKEEDIPYLMKVSIDNFNPYDRIHADRAFTKSQADKYIGKFIQNAVRGFADIVIVPDLPNRKPFAFLAFNSPVKVFDYQISRLVLAASDITEERGWLFKLLIETKAILREKGTTHLTTITQSSNIPAIRSWEKSGFRFGFCTHIFSYTTR